MLQPAPDRAALSDLRLVPAPVEGRCHASLRCNAFAPAIALRGIAKPLPVSGFGIPVDAGLAGPYPLLNDNQLYDQLRSKKRIVRGT